MTNPQTITQLIEDLQAAEVGTRALDARIFSVFFDGRVHLIRDDNGNIVGCHAATDDHNWIGIQLLSKSIDAAMTPILEWMFFGSMSHTIAVWGIESFNPTLWPSNDEQGYSEGRHKSIPLAICITSLYAILKELETT